jgi:hypothetical protein
LTALLAVAPAAWAQNVPHLAYALPAGGQQGTTFQMKVGGQFLPNVNNVQFSGGGVEARILDFTRPMNGMQATELRDRMQELQKQPVSEAVRKEIIDIRVKLFLFNYERNISPVLAETMTLEVTIASDAEPGKRELRVQTPQGLSNPLFFYLGRLPEFHEKETISVNTPPGPNPQPQITQPPTDMPVTLPATINGRIKPGFARPQLPARPGQPFTPGDADRYRFQARQGQRVVVSVAAQELIPYLADAVPGWFQATIGLLDAAGKELAYNDDFRFHPDPVLYYEIPKDGEYVIEIKDAIYRGREDFIYRITIGELPFITGIFPLGGRAGNQTPIKLTGWNLPTDSMVMDGKGKEPGILSVSESKENLVSNRLPFAVDTLPEALEKEPNNTTKNAQRAALPLIVNGRIDQPGDWDVFSLEGRAGDEVVAEVLARRMDSPLDSVLRLTDAVGRQVAFNDDFQDKSAGLETHHADSFLQFKLPDSGTYYLFLGDAQQKGGPEYAYRLRISAPRPDFELRIAPSALNVTAGMTVPIAVYALRKDGFAGEISLSLRGAPRGFILGGGLIPAGQDMVRLTLTAPQPAPLQPVNVSLEGRAILQGAEVRRQAVPAENMMQAFAYRHLVPMQDLTVFVRRGGAFRAPIRIAGAAPLRIPAGGTAGFQALVALPPNNVLEKIQYELSEPPEGITIGAVNILPDGAEIVLQCDAAKAKPGLKGNLIINISGERMPPAVATKAPATRQRVPLGTLPAVSFEIVDKK